MIMFNKEFGEVYMKFKLKFYKSLFEKIQSRETSLTTVDLLIFLLQMQHIRLIHLLRKATLERFSLRTIKENTIWRLQINIYPIITCQLPI